MKIYYQDEYGEEIYIAYNKNAVPRTGDTVVISEEGYKVRDVTWNAENDDVIVEVTQNLVRAVKETKDNTAGRLAEVNGAIVKINKRQEEQGKKQRILTEQLVSIRSFLRNQKGN